MPTYKPKTSYLNNIIYIRILLRFCLLPVSRPVFTHGPPGPRPWAANFQGRHIKKIEIEVWYAEKKGCPRERNLREIYTENNWPYKTTNVMHWILFIRQILLLSPTCFEYQVLIFRRTWLYTSSIWYRHSRVLVPCWYAAIAAYQQDTRTLIESDGTICCLCTTMSSWRWVLDTRNM